MKKIVISFLLIASLPIYSQGCSDAGICTFSALSNTNKDTLVNKNTFDFGSSIGMGVESVFYINGSLSYSRKFKNSLSLSSRLTYNQASGDFGTRGQFGDLFLSSSFKLVKNWGSSIGFKIPLSNANLKINSVSLPMDYQASLGTLDLLAGFNFTINKIKLDGAIQLPIINWNKNSYFDEYSLADEFPTTNLFERKPDVLLRTTYNLSSASNKWNFKPNLLLIYHIGNDTFENIFGEREAIKGSQGLTANANLITSYKITDNQYIENSIAFPFIVREIRPDGLTRSFTFSLNYKINF